MRANTSTESAITQICAITQGDDADRLCHAGSTVVFSFARRGRDGLEGCGPWPVLWRCVVTTIPMSPSTEVAVVEPLFSDGERSALVGFLAGYSGQTRDAYTLDLRQYTTWCATHGVHLFDAKRGDIECYARDLEAKGRARAAIARRVCTVAGFYRYAVEEELLEHSPAAHVRRPGWTTSRTRLAWTATRSARCWSPQGLARRPSTR
jgi:hypothetical protein